MSVIKKVVGSTVSALMLASCIPSVMNYAAADNQQPGNNNGFDWNSFNWQQDNPWQNPNGWQQQNNDQQQTNNTSQSSEVIKIMPVGDSITNGDGDPGGYRKHLYDSLTKKGYKIDMVGPNGKDSASNGGINYDDNHAGFSGYQIKEVPGWGQQQGGRGSLYNELKNNSAVKKAQPDIILLMIGTNDLTANRSMDACASDLRAVLDYMLSEIPSGGVIFLASVPEHTAYGGNPQEIASYNSTVKKVAEEYKDKNVIFADVHGCLDGMNDISNDQLHPNSGGYKKIGYFWADTIDSYIQASKPAETTTTTTTTTTTATTTTTQSTTTTTETTTTTTESTTTTTETTTTTTESTTTATETTTTTTETTTTTPETTTTTKLSVTLLGDSNLDGGVNIADAILIMQAIANPDSYGLDGSNPIHITAQGWENADCCSVGDGVTINDALAIQKFTLKLIDELPEKD